MSIFERYLTVWVALCIIVGIALGRLLPGVFHLIGTAEIAKVNMPVAMLIWLMIVPMLVKIDFTALSQVKEHWRGIGVTLFINWAIKPFSMRSWAGSSSDGCSGPICRPIRSTATLRD
jgi:arsenite transporter